MSKTLVNILLHIPHGTFASRYLNLYISFFISWSIHHIGSLNTPYIPAVKDQFIWLMSQPVAISFEDFIIWAGKRTGIRPCGTSNRPIVLFCCKRRVHELTEFCAKAATYAVGYLWVFCWCSFFLRYGASYAFHFGLGALENPLVWSVVDLVL